MKGVPRTKGILWPLTWVTLVLLIVIQWTWDYLPWFLIWITVGLLTATLWNIRFLHLSLVACERNLSRAILHFLRRFPMLMAFSFLSLVAWPLALIVFVRDVRKGKGERSSQQTTQACTRPARHTGNEGRVRGTDLCPAGRSATVTKALRKPRQAKKYDLFVSYKSEDICLVRRISERLYASGYRIWFAEYRVLLQNYDRFQEQIDKAIRRSRYGLCFTNNRYVRSEHTRREIEQLLESGNCGPGDIIEIQVPAEAGPHSEYPELAHSRSTEHQFLEATLRYIEGTVGKPILPGGNLVETARHLRRDFEDGRETYSLEVGGWEVAETLLFRSDGHDLEGPHFTRYCDGHLLVGTLIVGDQVHRPRASADDVNDRECYRAAIDFAKLYYIYERWPWGTVVERLRGLHLVFLHGHSHIGFTTQTLFRRWYRRYSVVLPYPRNRQVLEFAFLFRFEGSFSDFCRHAYLMDDLVLSLRLETSQTK